MTDRLSRVRIVLVAIALIVFGFVAWGPARDIHRATAATFRAWMGAMSGDLPEFPVIGSGREREVRALFRGHPLGSQPTPGWRFMELSLRPRSIEVRVDGPAGRAARMTLRHPDDVSRPTTRSASFSVGRAGDGGPDGERALDVLVGDLVRNDDGRFWRSDATALAGAASGALVRKGRWLLDGMVVLALVLLALSMLLHRALRGQARRVGLVLGGVVIAGALYRLAISVPTTMDVWPYSRLLALPRMLFHGPGLGATSALFGLRVHLNELILAYTLGAALLAPLAVFVHARALLGDPRAALWSAGVVCTLPAHIRFSHSDTGFIPSAVYASMTFALVAQALRDSSRAWRVVALVAVPWLMLLTMEQRALNVMFPALYIAQVWLLQPREVPRSRRVLVSAVVALTACGFVLGGFAERNHLTIAEGLRPSTLVNAARGLVRPRFNTLIHFGITPPLTLGLALLGLRALWRGGQRGLAAFLVAWGAMFYVANSLIVPATAEMQSRYHLHLAAPFALAAGWGAQSLVDALRAHPRARTWPVAAAIGAYLACVPLLHLRYERRADFNDIREYEFVRSARDRVPRGCTVLEHFTPGVSHDLRFARMGRVLDRGRVRDDVRAMLVTAAAPATSAGTRDPLVPDVRAILEDPPDCLMFYRGMPCVGVKEPGVPIAPACAALMETVPMDRVEGVRFRNVPYDETVSGGVMRQDVTIELGLYRVRVGEIRARHRTARPP